MIGAIRPGKLTYIASATRWRAAVYGPCGLVEVVIATT
jgi:hypothetical protein